MGEKKKVTSPEEALTELANMSGDPEADHSRADEILCELLESLGFAEVVEAWEKIEKWYA